MAGILSDELSKQMDADLFGEPRKSSLDPKLSGEMDKDLGLTPSRPWSGAIKPAEPEEPGYMGALGKGIYTGFRRRLPEMVGQAIQFTGVAPETGKAIAEVGTAGEERPQFKSPLKQVLYEGGEMLAPSVAIPAALGVAGVGVLPASIATAGLFGLSQAQATREEAEKRGVEPGAAPYATGAIEALGETAGTAALTRLLGPLAPILTRGGKVAVKDVIKPTVSRLLKEFPRTMAIEGGTEFGQQFGQALVEKGAGIRPEAEPLKEGVGVLGPTAVLTGLTMGMAVPSQRLRARSIEKSLEDEKTPEAARRTAADYVASYMAEADEEFAKRWRTRADQAITGREKIPVDQNIYEWLGEGPKGVIPEEPKEAIPSQPKGFDLIEKKPAEAEEKAPPEAPAGLIPQREKTAVEEPRDLLEPTKKAPAPEKPAPGIPAIPEETKAAIPETKPPLSEMKGAIRERKEAPRGYFPAEELWNRKVGEVQDEWQNLMSDYEDLKAGTQKQLEPLRKELESLKGKRDKFSAARKKEIQKEIDQKEQIYEAIPGQAENRWIEEHEKFRNLVGEEAKKRGIPEDRLEEFLTDYEDISAAGGSASEYNYDKSHRQLFEDLVQEYLTPEEKEEAPKAAIPAEEKPKAPAAAIPAKIEEAAAEAATSPANILPEPTEAQKEAGNYPKGHVNVQGLDISIENPRGSYRYKVDQERLRQIAEKVEGSPRTTIMSALGMLEQNQTVPMAFRQLEQAHTQMMRESPQLAEALRDTIDKGFHSELAHHYGYIRRTEGKDGDHVDVFIGPEPQENRVFVVDQVDPKTGKFDEHKVIMGFRTEYEARKGYLSNYEPGWKGLGAIKELSIDEFKKWLEEGDTTKPIAMKGAIPFAERRKDLEKRKRIGEMTEEEMKKELLTDPLTGLGNRRAYEESERLPVQAMIDVDSLKFINDTMGHEAGDELLKAVGKALGTYATRAFHTSGDEFIIEGETRPLVEAEVLRAQEILIKAEIEATAPDGSKYTYKGLGISYGIGGTLKEADNALSRDKQERERRGLRAPRGERPKGLGAIPAPGVEAAGEAAREVEEPTILPADWIEAGWKIENRGVLQIATSPEGKEYTLWGQRLRPITEAPKAAIPAPEPERQEIKPSAEWEKAFRDRIRYISPTGKVIRVQFKEGDYFASRPVGKEGPEAAVEKLKEEVFRKLPNLEPLPEEPAAREEEDTYKGISIFKPVRDLTDEEFEKIIAPTGIGMERKNEQISQYENDPRFNAHLKQGEIGYQPGLPENRQPVSIDWYAVREYIKSGKLPERGEKIEKMANRLKEIDPSFDEQGALKTGSRILQAIESGIYNDMLHPGNSNSRKVFQELTRQKLPPGVSNTRKIFEGKPFPADFSKIEKAGREIKAEPPNLARRLSPSERQNLEYSEFKKVSDDYYIQKFGREVEKAEGKPVKIPGFEGFDFFQRKVQEGKFVVSEGITGVLIASDRTEKEAILAAREILKKRGPAVLQDAIVKTALNNGITPRYTIEKKGTKPAPAKEAPKAAPEGPKFKIGDIVKPKPESGVLKSIQGRIAHIQTDPDGIQRIRVEGLNAHFLANNFELAGEEAKDTITYTFKKEFEEQNRKNVEGLSYVGELVKREEQPNDWVKLTYRKISETKPEEKKAEAAPVEEAEEEEEITPRSIPFEAVKYANAIKNKLKKNYAWAYLKWKTGKIEEKPDPKGLSTLAAQIVRISVDKILGEPYKFKPQVGEAKAEGGEAHETRRSEEVGEGQLVGRPPGVAPGERTATGEEPLRERPGEAGRTPEPGREEGVSGVHELEARGQGGRERGVRAGRLPAAPGEPARAAAGGARREGQGLGRAVRPRRPTRVEDRNHVIAPDDTLVPGGKISRVKANIAAIELAKSLEKEKRNPTPEEKKILAQFTGWGALGKEAFEPEEWIRDDVDKNGTLKGRYAYAYFSEEDKKEYKTWFDRIGKKLHPELGGLLSQEEWDEAKSSILNAFYTSRDVIENGLWPIINRLGFKGGTILEPAGGVGHILGLMPQNLAESSRIQAIEKDRLSGLILSKLYPEAKVFVKGFEQSREIRDNSVDLVVSNFPFGDIRIFDPKHKDYSGFSIHNYFFARSIDALKPGGILVAITSHYTLDSAGTEHRKYLASKADFVGGLRLPGTAFEKTAGTEVTTDILIFRKKDSSNFKGESFIDTHPEELAEKDEKGNPKTAYINEYFAMYPHMVLGKHSLQGTMYAKDTYALLPFAGKDLKTLLPEHIGNLPENIAGESSIEVEPAPMFAEEGTKEGLILEKEGKIFINEGGRLNPIFGVQKADPVRKYIAVRTALKDLITMEIGEGTDAGIEAQRKKLNRLYDAFVAKHGFISSRDNRWLRADAEFSLMSSLEAEDKEKSKTSKDKIYKKAAILSQRTNFPFREPETAASEEDALKISLTYRNKIDLPYVAKLLGTDNETVKESIVKKRIAYLNPSTGNLESPDEYLSGNVREKLEKAKESAKDDPTFDINVEELTKVQPADLAINQIYYRLGSPWIPTEAIENFMGDLLNFKDVEVKYLETAETSKFTVQVKDTASYRLRENAAITNVWGVEGANALSLIEDSLNLRFTAIYDSVWDPDQKKEKPVFNPQKSQAAREMQRKLNDEFVKWTRKHEKWAGELAGIYNRDFNNTVLKEFPVPEMEYYPNASHSIRLRKHQRRAVSRNLQESCIDAHAVGTGKTYIFATTAMEMRRLGTAKKPMIVVQNSTVHQYAKAFRELYPTANILIPNKKQLSKENRKRLISQIVTGNFDAIIVPHSAFDMISVTPAKEAAYIREQVGDLERIINEMRAEDEDKRTIRQIEKLKEAKEQKLLKLLSGKREDIIYFDELGVDALLMDEAHRYKRGEFYTKMTKIKGIDRQSASRSMLMLLKAQEVSKRTGGKNVIMATGTPLSNTLAEIWTMLRYVRPDLLERFNARQFDSFAANFGQVVQETEETPSGDFKVIERFAKYVNGPEILSMWRSAADIVLPEDVDVERPKIRTGKPIDLQLNRSQELANFIKWIKAEREAWDRLPGKEKMESSHVPLVLFGLAKKAAIDLRLVSPKMPDLPGSKVNRCVEEVFSRWKASEKFRAAQVVFSDTFQSSDKSFNLFKDLKKKLIEKGIPANEIAIIHDFNSDDRRDELFGKVTDGDVRVVMGTTEKLGVGVNIQDRLLAAHHIDVPQRPMDFEQRNGRIWRPGNLNDEIDILVYGVKNTLDSTGFQRLLIKQKFINQIMRGDIHDRSFDDPFDPTQATFQDMMSAFGNPKVREKFGLENQIRDLNSLKESHENEIGRARRTIDQNKFKLRDLRESLKNWDEISKILSDAFPDNKVADFAFTVKGKMTKMDKDHFLQAIQDQIDEIEKRAQEIIGRGEFDISRDFFNAEKQVRELASTYANFHAELNGVPVTISFFPSTTGGMKDNTHFLSFEGVGIEYSLRPKEYKEFNYYLQRKVSTPGGILISMQSLVPYGIGHPREIRDEITKTENNIKNLQPLLDQPFDREAEIQGKKARLADVEKELMAAESETEEQAAQKKEKEKAELDSLRHEYGEVGDRLYAEKKKIEETPAEPEKEVKPGEQPEEGEEALKLEKGKKSFGPSIDELLAKPDIPVTKIKSRFKGKFKEARVWALSNIRGELVDNKDTGMEIVISRDAIEKATSASAVKEGGRAEHLEALQKLRALLENAVLAESHPDSERNRNIAAIHRFYAPIDIDGILYAAKLTVKEYALKEQKPGFYTHELTEIEMPAAKRPVAYSKNELIPGRQTGISKLSVANLLKNARRNDGTPFLPSAPEPGLKPAKGREGIKPEIIPATAATSEELKEIEESIRKIAPGEVSFKQALYLDMRKEKHQAALLKHGYSKNDLARIIADGDFYFKVAGRMTPVRFGQGPWEAIINVATGGKDALQIKGDALHEAFEAVRSFMLTDKEVKILDARYPGKEGRSASEVQADIFADFVLKKKAIPLSVRGILEKIRAFFDRLGNFLEGLGFKNAEDIFEAAAEGRIRERYEAAPGQAAPQLAAQAWAPPFYSTLQRTIEKKMGGSMPVPQLRVLLKQPGIKQEEVKWSGIDDFLAGKEGKVTKQEVLNFLDANKIEIREVQKGDTGNKIELSPDQSRNIIASLEKGMGISTARAYGILNEAMVGNVEALSTLEQALGDRPELLKPFWEGKKLFEGGGPARYDQWQLPGGENYRELLFTLPGKDIRTIKLAKEGNTWGVKNAEGEFLPMNDYESAKKAVQTARLKATEEAKINKFSSSHWAEPNVLAHVRFNERTGITGKKVGEFGRIEMEERVLFVEEIQSDWHQQGKKRGYKDLNARERALLDEYKKTGNIPSGVSEAEIRSISDKAVLGLPSAPFAKTWHEFVLKRMVRWAAENGFDRIAWTTGEQQAERYQLSRAVERIEWTKTEFIEELAAVPKAEDVTVTLSIAPKDRAIEPEELYREIGQRTGLHWDTDPDAGPLLYVPADRLEEVLGKDMSRRLLEDPSDMGSFEGEDLKIGGEGMRGFYDKIIPDFLNKFGKKWGAKVEETRISTYDKIYDEVKVEGMPEGETGVQVHSLPITESMKKAALEEGFPLFRLPGELPGRQPLQLEEIDSAEIREVLSRPEASVMEAVQEKQHLKSLIRAEIEGGDIPEGSAVRFADAGYIKSVLRQGRLPEGASFEGRAGISATRVKRGITPVAYGSNYRHSAAIAIPKEYIRGTGNAPNEVLIDPKTPLDRLRFYIDGQDRSFTIDELRQLGALREERVPAFKLEGPIRKILDSLKSPDLPAEAEQDKGFKNSIKKTRLGLVKVTDNDLKLWERALSLPFWLQDKYKELRPLVHTQMKREENRSETIHGLLNRARPFFALKGDEMGRVEKALVQGDREGKVYEEADLREKFNLGAEGVNGYRAVRKTLDWIHAEWKARIEENVLREYKKEKWFALFKAAHGLEFSDEETLALDKALKRTRKAMEKPVETVRAHLQRVFEEEFSPRNKQLLADLLGDYIKAYRRARKQIDKIKEIVRDAIGEGMSEEEINQNTQYLVQAYIRSLPAMNQLKELRSQLNRIRGYFPRSRKQGKYRVVVTDSFEDAFGEKQRQTVYYQNAANRIEATKIYDKIKADPEYKDMEIAVEPIRQEAETTFMGASAINMQRLVDNAIDKLRAQGDLPAEIASLIRMNVLETLADELKARGAGRFAIRRAGNIIEGYQKTNLKEVLKDYIDGWSGMITKQEAALEFLDELKMIPRSKPQVMAYGSKYAQDMLRNQEPMDRISAKMRSLAFLYFLGGSLRATTVNFTQNYVTGIPFLARGVGAKSLKAEKIYHKAMFDVAVGKNLSEVEKRMLDEMINKGVAEDQFIRQIHREVKGALGQWTGKVVDILSKPFSWMEKLNRKSAALSMFRVKMEKYKAQGMEAERAYRKAFDEAQDFVYKTHYLMTKANLPSMAAGGEVGAQFLKTAYTFRRFTHNYLLSLHHSMKGPEGTLALDVMARSLAYVVILAGIPAIPFLDDLLDEWEKFFGTPVRSNMRKTLREAGGPLLEKMGMAGIPALMGIDISGSLKTGIPLIGAGTPQDTIYGVYGGLARKSLNAMSAVEREDYLRALEFASPAFIEAVLKAYRMSDAGLTTPRGKIITDEQGRPIRLGTGEGVAQAAGFRPERVARISGEHWTMENVQKHFKGKRDDLYSRYRLAKTPEDKKKVLRDMQRFNLDSRKYPGVIPPIMATALREAALQRPEKAFLNFGRMGEEKM